MSKPLALVTGVGPGTGSAIVRRLAGAGYDVAMMARTEDRLSALAQEVAGARAYACDVGDAQALNAAIDRVIAAQGAPEIVVHNAVGGAFGSFDQIKPETLLANFHVNTMALLILAQRLSPAMIEKGRGVFVATGNTSATRGKAQYAGFAPTKAAQRILAESMARQLGPKGVHVAYVIIDAVIDLAWTRAHFADKPDAFFIKPEAIAAEVLHVIQQDRSAWSFNVEIRPFGETW